jgi:hypothetical protein
MSSRPRSRHGLLPGLALATVVLLISVGCSGGDGSGDDDGETAAPPASTTTTTVPPAPSSTSTSAPEPATTDQPADCRETSGWTTEAADADPMVAEDLYLVRPGRHGCYDRVVFDVNGVVDGPGTVGFHVAYVDGGGDVTADGSGEPVPAAGGAALTVVVRAPAQGTGTSGHQPGRLLARVGDPLVTTDQVAGWPALREVVFAGSFEGQTTFAVGVDRRLPFRVGASESDGVTHVYVDIARP